LAIDNSSNVRVQLVQLGVKLSGRCSFWRWLCLKYQAALWWSQTSAAWGWRKSSWAEYWNIL